MFDTKEESLDGLKNLPLPTVFVDIWAGNGPSRFRRQFDVPARFFEVKQPLELVHPKIRNYLPILELNREAIYAYDSAEREFVEYYYGDIEATVIGRSYQQFIGGLFVDLGYAGLETLVSELAEQFEFHSLDKLKDFLAQEDELDAAEAKRRFVAALG